MSKADEFVTMAASQIGTKESPSGSNKTKYGKWYGLDGNPWCAMFVSWCSNEVGGLGVTGKYAYCPSWVNYAKKLGKWLDREAKPQPGDIIFFSNGKRACHVGIVETRNGTSSVTTIEGNTSTSSNDNGGAVMRRKRSYGTVGSSWYILGFFRPDWASLDKSEPKNGFVKENGKVYYYVDDVKQYGWQTVYGAKRYFKSDTGERMTGLCKIYGEYYYLDPTTGILTTGWVTFDGGTKRYFKSDTGVMLTGLQKIYGNYYAFASDGAMLTGTVTCQAADDGTLTLAN